MKSNRPSISEVIGGADEHVEKSDPADMQCASILKNLLDSVPHQRLLKKQKYNDIKEKKTPS